MMQNTEINATGEWGEILVNRYLREKGYRILASNFRCRFGEADLICRDKKNVIIVEVKAQAGNRLDTPAAYVTEQKQRKLALTASCFLKHSGLNLPLRFDVAEVIFEKPGQYKKYTINYIKDAFRI